MIRLKDIVDQIEISFDEIKSFLNTRTGEIISVSDEELRAAEEGESLENYPEWEHEIIQKAKEIVFSDDWITLPEKFDINEYSIMEKFCSSVEDDDKKHRLLNSIHGRGAFRYFKDTIHEFGIVDDWYEYRKQAFKRIAIEWLESHDIAFTDDKE
ncbi:MAG: UPF0158 family protein [Candidatus Electryonea clarkiae]|nr:UPF0158 family protein [Candidatus Electryonea clarkiae]MDP8285162.1 UPF0158 family protein [Candidatus Electryonea clarkiae]